MKLFVFIAMFAFDIIIGMDISVENQNHSFGDTTNNITTVHSHFVKAIALYDRTGGPMISSDEIPYWTEILYDRVLPEIGYKIITFATQITRKNNPFIYMRNFLSSDFVVKKQFPINSSLLAFVIYKNNLFTALSSNYKEPLCINLNTFQETTIIKKDYYPHVFCNKGIVWISESDINNRLYESFDLTNTIHLPWIKKGKSIFFCVSGDFIFINHSSPQSHVVYYTHLKPNAYKLSDMKKRLLQTGFLYPDQIIESIESSKCTIQQSKKYSTKYHSKYVEGKNIIVKKPNYNLDVWKIQKTGECTLLYTASIRGLHPFNLEGLYGALFNDIFLMSMPDQSIVALDIKTQKISTLKFKYDNFTLLRFNHANLILYNNFQSRVEIWQCAKKGFGTMDISQKQSSEKYTLNIKNHS